MFRWLGVLFLLAALACLSGDLYLWWAGTGPFQLNALGYWWFLIDKESLQILQPAIERHVSPTLWIGVQTVLEWPAALDFGVPGAIFWLLRRRRLRRRENLKFRR